MGNYIQLLFENISLEKSEMLVAALSEEGYEGFEEDEHLLKAFIESIKFDAKVVNEIAGNLQVSFSKSVIEETNWNEVWESGFDPVMVDDFVAVRADFHKPVEGVMHEIVITPKMSFGTGHHATTWLMMSEMRELDFANKVVLDFGTGTGILAILAEKLGASSVVAIDYDEWSIANCRENILQNHSSRIKLLQADNAKTQVVFDIILANINRNVILDNMAVLTKQLTKNGVLVLSGLLSEDEPVIRAAVYGAGLKVIKQVLRHNWLCLKASY